MIIVRSYSINDPSCCRLSELPHNLPSLKEEDKRGYFVFDNEEVPDENANGYIIQRWIQKWDSFVNVSHFSNILNGDKLKTVAKRGVKPTTTKVTS